MSTSVVSKDKSKAVTIYPKDIIKCDLKEYEFKYFRDIIESQITENMIQEKRVKVIKKVFEEFTNDEIKEEYIIVVATDVSYFLHLNTKSSINKLLTLTQKINRQKLNGLLIFLIGDVCIFIYKPKHLEVPKMLKLEHIEKEPYMDKYDQIMSKIKIINQKGFDNEQGQEAVNKIVEYIGLYYLKHQQAYGMKGSRFEEDFHLKVRNHMVIYSGVSYYHCFMGRRLDIQLTQDNTYNKYLEVEMNFAGIIPNINSTYKLVIFNKRGSDPSIVDLAKFKLKELFAFLAMLMIFVSLVVCRDFDPTSEHHSPHYIRDSVCPHKSEMMSISLTVFLSVMFQKMYNKFKERRQKKIELLKKVRLEKLD